MCKYIILQYIYLPKYFKYDSFCFHQKGFYFILIFEEL